MDLLDPGGAERIEHVGRLIDEKLPATGHERMGLAGLRCASAYPVRDAVEAGGRRIGVPFEESHRSGAPGQEQRGGQAAQAGTDDDRGHPSTAAGS